MAGYGEWNGNYCCCSFEWYDSLFYWFLESLFGCFNDLSTCLCGFCCTPCLFGQNAEKTDGSSCFLWCCAYMCLTECYLCWLPHYFKRAELRQRYGLREDPSCGDLFTTICCSPCALCQEARFLKRNGIVER
jgi:Cys-rich protein (TIGR01571 family)